MTDSKPVESEKPSKSRRKDDMLALQKIGESLTKLTDEQLLKIDLPDNLLTAIKHSRLLTSNEAKRRQLQYIGKIMRQLDAESIKETLKGIQLIHEKNVAQFQQIEEWRTKLISSGDNALNSFLEAHPESDRQQLRQLIRKAQQDIKNNKNTGAEKLLFKYLRALLENLAGK
jgi:ribosome-associated protein